MSKQNRSLEKRKARAGWLFSLPFVIGFVFFFFAPVLRSVIMSFQTMYVSGDGNNLHFVGWENYYKLFQEDPTYLKHLVQSLQDLAINFPCVLLFSFFMAIILNQKFRGRLFARAIFFLPVVVSSGVVMLVQNSQVLQTTVSAVSSAGSADGGVGQLSAAVMGLLSDIQIDSGIFEFVTGAVSRVYDITIMSGIQILIFLSGLQAIPPALYEASAVEGATGWENFWKITFPMISPMILVNAVYTIIDSMSGTNNSLMYEIYQKAFQFSDFGYSAAMSWIYFIIIAVILAVFIALCNRLVYYEN